MLRYLYTLILAMFVGLSFSYAQQVDPSGEHPCDAKPFCSDSTYLFPNVSGYPATVQGPNYGCLFTQPNQIWYFMRIGTPGTIQLTIHQTNLGGGTIDVDYAMWGPFMDLELGCQEVMNGVAPLQCSYSASATETIGLGMAGGAGAGASTPPAAQAGEYYIIVLTNYSNQAGQISFNQTGGTGSTDCSIMYCDLEVGNNSPVCAGTPFELWATNDTASFYEWRDPNDNVIANTANTTTTWNLAGTYTYTMTSIIGDDTCVGTTDVTLLPSTYDTTRQEICQGEFYEFENNRYYTSGLYAHTFTGASGCDSILVLDLTVNPLPNVKIDGPSEYIFCRGDNITIGVEDQTSSINYQWYKDGSAILGETGPKITITASGVYHVEAISHKGCSSISSTVSVRVYENPTVSITKSTDHVMCTYDTISLTAHADMNVDYYWEPEYPFRHISGAHNQKVDGVFLEGSELVTVRVVTPQGCSGTAEAKVWVKPCCEVNVPTAFSPDNDGVNDIFSPILRPTQRIVNFSVYDRYGTLVYETSASSNETLVGWDGNYPNGNPAKIDTYMYVLEYSCSDGKNYIKKGDVTLVR